MKPLALAVALLGGFFTGAVAMLWLVDRLLGGDGPKLILDEPGGRWLGQ